MKCVEICSFENELVDPDEMIRFEPGELSARRFTTLTRMGNDSFVRRHCLHCVEPACAAACLVGALHQTPEGPVVYDTEKCIGCRYCMLACPFHAVRYEWESNVPLVMKCEMCYERPEGPACVQACRYDATMFGDRADLLRIAHDRIDSEPDVYLPKVWGEKEMGGTCVLFVSDTDLDPLWPGTLGEHSVPDLTEPVVHKTPYLAFGVAGFLIATSWVIGRRNRLAGEQAAARAESGVEDNGESKGEASDDA
jgi:formate dehydrogenase iron-sulfur subunit